MSEHGSNRPRRAMDPADGFETEGPDGPDDTPVDQPSPARRGALPEEPGGNPFARPGSLSAASAPAPGPLASTPVEAGDPPGPVLPVGEGRRMGEVADEGPRPIPRRSAVSSTTPPEPVLIPAPATGATAGPLTTAGAAGASPTPGSSSWLDHHRRTLVVWVVGALVAALVIAGGFYLVSRSTTGTPGPIESPTAPSTASSSASPVPDATTDDLMTVEQAEQVVPGASWAVTATAEQRSDMTAQAACLTGEDGDANPVISLQRTFGTSDDDRLAALHQVDVYASEDAAAEVQAQRTATLAACNQVPTLIVSSTAVEGLADEVQQLTVAYQNDPAEYHALLLVRTGRALTIIDVVRDGAAVETPALVAGISESLSGMCERVEGTCPASPAFAPTVPPPAPPSGWLLTSDFPRITPGTGQWTATDPGQLTARGMGCENMPLATEPGPAARAQRTYLLTQDENTPATFGVDEMIFDFATPEAAGAFVAKLGGNLANCKDRVLTATVTEHSGIVGEGAGGAKISARAFTIQQATSETSSVIYQLTVAVTGHKVNYLLTSVTEEFRFTDDQLANLALRGAQRLSQ